jgi:hypothetical protein
MDALISSPPSKLNDKALTCGHKVRERIEHVKHSVAETKTKLVHRAKEVVINDQGSKLVHRAQETACILHFKFR